LHFLPHLQIIPPKDLTIDNTGSIISLIKIKNSGRTVLSGIRLSTSTNSKGLELFLDNPSINFLNIDEEFSTNLRIISKNFDDEKAEIIIKAESINPQTTDQARFLINLKFKILEIEAKAKEQLEFLRNLLKNNLECTQINEFIKKGEEYYKNKQYNEVLKITDDAIQNCKNLLSLQGKELRLPKKETLSNDLLVLGIEGFAFLIITYLIYNYYKKRKFKNK